MFDAERKRLIEAEAELLRTKKVRRPIYDREFALVVFAMIFAGAILGGTLPKWMAVGVVPILVFAFAWYRCSVIQSEFDTSVLNWYESAQSENKI